MARIAAEIVLFLSLLLEVVPTKDVAEIIAKRVNLIKISFSNSTSNFF
jgi:hypothetical protein